LELEVMARALQESGDYRVLRRLVPRHRIKEANSQPIGRLAEPRIEVSKVGVGEHGAQPFSQQYVGVAARERGSGNPSGVVGHRRERLLREERHRGPPGRSCPSTLPPPRALPVTAPTGSARLIIRESSP
jgi:hypothetical protein